MPIDRDTGSVNFIEQLKRSWHKAWPLAILLLIFTIYAPAVRLMPFHDDAVLMPAISNRNLITIFENRPYGDGHHRPMSYEPWLIVRDLYGWFIPALMHNWNLLVHVLNTTLVLALARRIARRFSVKGILFPMTTVLIFGLYPQGYESVLWSSAIVHPLMTLFGLAAMHAYLQGRTVRLLTVPEETKQRSKFKVRLIRHRWTLISLFFILLACLSHEMGFVFGPLILTVEILWVLAQRQPFDKTAAWVCGLSLLYPVYYRLFLITKWTTESSKNGIFDLMDIVPKLSYQFQGFVDWILIYIRGFIGNVDQQSAILILIGLFAVSIAGVLLFLTCRKRLSIALLALGFWVVAIAPSTLTLSLEYIWTSPRMTYLPSIGTALFWGIFITSLYTILASRALRIALLTLFVVTILWSVRFIADWMNEAARLTPALRLIDADIRQSSPSARLLIINSSFVSLRTQPAWLVGQEGMPLWEYDADNTQPMWAWPSAVSGIVRTTMNVRHDISLTSRETRFSAPGVTFTQGKQFYFGVFGELVDDVALRTAILDSNYVYRFDYDEPGFRVSRLAIVGNAYAPVKPLAVLSKGPAQIVIDSATATKCDGFIQLDMAWAAAAHLAQPTAVFVHVIDINGQQILAADRDPVSGYLPIDQLPSNASINETRILQIPQGSASIREIRVGLYNRANGSRFTALKSDSSAWNGDEITIPIAASDHCSE